MKSTPGGEGLGLSRTGAALGVGDGSRHFRVGPGFTGECFSFICFRRPTISYLLSHPVRAFWWGFRLGLRKVAESTEKIAMTGLLSESRSARPRCVAP